MSDFRLDAAKFDILPLDGAPASAVIPADDFYYASDALGNNAVGLQNANIVTELFDASPPANALSERGFPRADGEYAETSYYRRTLITLKGAIAPQATRAAMEALMDTLAAAFAYKGGTLKVTKAGSSRYYDNCYPATIEKLFGQRQFYHSTWIPWEIQLVCLQPYARNATRVVDSYAFDMTVSPTIYTLFNSGNAPSQLILTPTVLVAGTLSSLTITSVNTGEAITITAAFSNNDQISIDGEAKIVTLNGSPVDYTGVIPSVVAGGNSYSFTATGAGFDLSISARHFDRYF
jgi:hypothetical protein